MGFWSATLNLPQVVRELLKDAEDKDIQRLLYLARKEGVSDQETERRLCQLDLSFKSLAQDEKDRLWMLGRMTTKANVRTAFKLWSAALPKKHPLAPHRVAKVLERLRQAADIPA